MAKRTKARTGAGKPRARAGYIVAPARGKPKGITTFGTGPVVGAVVVKLEEATPEGVYRARVTERDRREDEPGLTYGVLVWKRGAKLRSVPAEIRRLEKRPSKRKKVTLAVLTRMRAQRALADALRSHAFIAMPMEEV